MLALFFFHFVMIGWIWCTRISLFIKCLGASQIFTFFLTPKCQHQKTRNIEIKFWLNRKKIKVLTGFLGQFCLLQHNWRNYVENFMKIVVWIRFLKYLFLVVSIWWTVRHMCVICCFESFGGKFKRRNIYDLDNSVVGQNGLCMPTTISKTARRIYLIFTQNWPTTAIFWPYISHILCSHTIPYCHLWTGVS